MKENNKLDWMMLLVTDIIKEESQLITTGFAPAEQIFGYKKLEDKLFFLPGVLSRKKQLLPEGNIKNIRRNKQINTIFKGASAPFFNV